MREDRGVSEVVGFILVFSLIMMTVSTVYVVGFDGLENARDVERVNNMDRAFDVLADNVEDIDQDGAPSRATELKLADGQIGFSDSTNITVDVGGVEKLNESTRPLVYTYGGQQVIYENGAVLRSQSDSAWMTRSPTMTFGSPTGDRSVVFSVLDLNAEGATSIGGSSNVLVRTTRFEGSAGRLATVGSDAGGNMVKIKIVTSDARAEVWRRYFESVIPDDTAWNRNIATPDADTSDGRTTVEVSFSATQWVLRVVNIGGDFE
ncbi:hypothetical protein ACFPYI_02725 [Halomarina salina]|uniref:Flagellin n=1 Tax=Halomarina salina TaxID=1872699 RepID=A0ABD5RIF6_9EURY|nr:hypothetical protein [Halomarina salina]